MITKKFETESWITTNIERRAKDRRAGAEKIAFRALLINALMFAAGIGFAAYFISH